jgi:hypothetical protein
VRGSRSPPATGSPRQSGFVAPEIENYLIQFCSVADPGPDPDRFWSDTDPDPDADV